MYINTNIVKHYNLNLQQVALLQILHQAKNEDVSEWLESYNGDLDVLHYKGFLSEVKAKSKQESVYKRLRLSKKGREVLDAIETPEVTEQHIKMRDYLIEMYLNNEDKERVVGNKKLVGIYISILQNYLGLDIYRFYYLCEFFLSEHIFTKKLENIFMDRNKIRYGDFKNHIEDSALYQFYEQRKQEVEWYWQQKIKK